MRRSTLALCGLLPTACLYLNPAFDPAGEGSSGGTTGAPTTGASTSGTSTSTATADATTTDATTTDATSTSSDVSTGAPDTTGSTGAALDLGGPVYPHYSVSSCLELQEVLEDDEETAVSGYYNLDVMGAPGTTVDVYCDMDIAGGGWTLVGRSAGDAQLGGFGWLSGRGAVDDDGQPYSLDLGAHPIAFTQILLGDYAAGKAWGERAYLFQVGQGYVQNNMDSLQKLGPPQAILGDCVPWATWMFQHGGYTSADQAFFFRDLDDIDMAYFGLLANGFYLHTYMTCEWTGGLNHKHGMLMVR